MREEPRVIQLHQYQRRALLSEKRIVACIAGLQSGKTTTGGVWLRKAISFNRDPEASFIVGAPTYRIMGSSTLPALMRFNSQLGHLNKTDMVFQLNHGPKVYLRSMDNEWSLEGITNTRGAWLDEGGLCSTQSFINLMGRCAPKQAPIFISTTPYNLHNFLYRDLYEPWKQGLRDDVEIIQWTSRDNPFFPLEEFERQRRILDSRMFALRYLGRFEKMAGLVYPDFDHGNYVDPCTIEKTKFHILAGVDWGTANSFAVAVRALSRDGKRDYQIAEHKQTGLTADEQVQVLRQICKRYSVDMAYGDSADPGMIALSQNKGVPMKGVEKGPGSVAYGVGLHAEIIRTKMYKLFRGKCPETEREYETYSYESPKDGKDLKDVPVKYNDHLMDANRYVTMETKHIRDKALRPVKAPKTHLQKLLAGDFAASAKDDEW